MCDSGCRCRGMDGMPYEFEYLYSVRARVPGHSRLRTGRSVKQQGSCDLLTAAAGEAVVDGQALSCLSPCFALA